MSSVDDAPEKAISRSASGRRDERFVVPTEEVATVNGREEEESCVLLRVAKALEIANASDVGHESGSPGPRATWRLMTYERGGLGKLREEEASATCDPIPTAHFLKPDVSKVLQSARGRLRNSAPV